MCTYIRRCVIPSCWQHIQRLTPEFLNWVVLSNIWPRYPLVVCQTTTLFLWYDYVHVYTCSKMSELIMVRVYDDIVTILTCTWKHWFIQWYSFIAILYGAGLSSAYTCTYDMHGSVSCSHVTYVMQLLAVFPPMPMCSCYYTTYRGSPLQSYQCCNKYVYTYMYSFMYNALHFRNIHVNVYMYLPRWEFWETLPSVSDCAIYQLLRF